MLIEIFIAVLLGICFGTITGMIPGIHTNLIGVFIVALSASFFSSFNVVYVIVVIVSMNIAHTFIDFIPSVFLGCPDTDTELSILPGHRLLKQGLGYEAIVLTCYGSLAAIFILIFISFPSIIFVPKIYDSVRDFIPFILIFISGCLIFTEKRRFVSFFVYLFTGLLGWSVLNMEGLSQPLLPLLTGLFGSSSLLVSIKNRTNIPEQRITKPRVKMLRPILSSLIASPLCSFFPGLGSGQAAVIGSGISKFRAKDSDDSKDFLVLIGATNTLVMGFSFLTFYTIEKTRTGAVAAISEIAGAISLNVLVLILVVVLVSGIVSFFVAIFLARVLSGKMNKVNYAMLSLGTLVLLVVVVFFVSGFMGLVVFVASTFTGIYCFSLGVRRTSMMGCLLIPTLIFYLV